MGKNYAARTYYPEATPSCYVEKEYYTDAPVYYTTTHAEPIYNTVAPEPKMPHVTQPRYYEALVYYTEEPKCYSSPSFYQTKAYNYYISKDPEYYTTTYAATTCTPAASFTVSNRSLPDSRNLFNIWLIRYNI